MLERSAILTCRVTVDTTPDGDISSHVRADDGTVLVHVPTDATDTTNTVSIWAMQEDVELVPLPAAAALHLTHAPKGYDGPHRFIADISPEDGLITNLRPREAP